MTGKGVGIVACPLCHVYLSGGGIHGAADTKQGLANRGMHGHITKLIKFGLVGIGNTMVDFAVYTLLVSFTGIDAVICNVISYMCGVLNSFVLNKVWTFSDAARGNTATRLLLFYVANGLGLVSSTFIVWLLADPLGPLIAKLIAVPCVFLMNYASSYLIFYFRK